MWLLLGQLIGTAIAVIFLLSLLGWATATNYAEKNVDFIDAYNVAWMVRQQIGIAYTFDRKHFSRFANITVQVPGI
jgi:predicted nucleic acid-binding protein